MSELNVLKKFPQVFTMHVLYSGTRHRTIPQANGFLIVNELEIEIKALRAEIVFS